MSHGGRMAHHQRGARHRVFIKLHSGIIPCAAGIIPRPDSSILVVAATPFYSTMPKKIPRRLAVVTVPTLRQYIFVIDYATHHGFSLDPDTLPLTTYYWYVAILLHLVYHRAIVHTGLSKGRDAWRRMRCAAIAKVTNSSDPAAYARS